MTQKKKRTQKAKPCWFCGGTGWYRWDYVQVIYACFCQPAPQE